MLAIGLLLTALAGRDVAAQIGELEHVNALYPRYIFDSTPVLAKRQVDNACVRGQHSCKSIRPVVMELRSII